MGSSLPALSDDALVRGARPTASGKWTPLSLRYLSVLLTSSKDCPSTIGFGVSLQRCANLSSRSGSGSPIIVAVCEMVGDMTRSYGMIKVGV